MNIGIEEFLKEYPLMSIRPSSNEPYLIFKGIFYFSSTYENKEIITDKYRLCIKIPHIFPKEIPNVFELENKIPRDQNHHVNFDGSLCLGSKIRILYKIYKDPTLIGFAKKCLIPYLYFVSYKLQLKKDFPFNELDHGIIGELKDYMNLFGLSNFDQVKNTIKLLGLKKKEANKLSCPCGCGKKLGKCKFNTKLSEFRKITDRSWFKSLTL